MGVSQDQLGEISGYEFDMGVDALNNKLEELWEHFHQVIKNIAEIGNIFLRFGARSASGRLAEIAIEFYKTYISGIEEAISTRLKVNKDAVRYRVEQCADNMVLLGVSLVRVGDELKPIVVCTNHRIVEYRELSPAK